MKRAVVVLGATATGKSGVAVRVAESVAGEIVNADALQAYRGLDIGTGKPTTESRRSVPHHLFDLVEPTERFSAGEFARRALTIVDEVAARGAVPIVVGGSGLYLRALLHGLADIPAVPGAMRRQLLQEIDADGLDLLYDELSRVDPPTARRLARADRHRIVRALEVARFTGRPLSAWLADESSASRPLAARKFGLTLPRAVLYDRIEARVHEMIDRGWPEEVRGLLERGTPTDAAGFQAIGYSDWIRHLQGEATRDETVTAIVTATRRYAKRQETWFRREPGVRWLDAAEPDAVVATIVEQIDPRS